MKINRFNYKGLVKTGFFIITKCRCRSESLGKCGSQIRGLISQYEDLNRNEQYRIYNSFMIVYRAIKSSDDWIRTVHLVRYFDLVYKAVRAAYIRCRTRNRKMQYRADLKTDKIFFLCSGHVNPAPDHAAYQNKIYIDRFWRTKVDGSLYYAVLSYIKNHDVKTVQYITGPPVYLITRPNCRHFFIPLDTYTVLHSSVRNLVDKHNWKEITHQDYLKIRSDTWNAVDNCIRAEYKLK